MGADDSSLDLKGILKRGFDEYREYINPLIANRAAMAGEPIRFVRAEDGAIVDADGRRFEDLHGTQAFGHRHPAITAAVRAYLESDALNWYPSRVNPFAGRLARVLCERSGVYSNVFFGFSGADAIEAALKLARALTRRPRILSLTGGYHGCTYGAVALMNEGPFRAPFAPHLPGAEAIPFGDVEALRRALEPGDVAAVVVEPVQGEGGVRELPRPFVEALCELTERHGTLRGADEVQTGLGRSGHFLYTATWPRRPEVALVAKQLGGGLMPVSAMLTRRELFERAYGQNFEAGESHNMTFSCNAVTAVAALATLELITDELMARIRRLGEKFRADLRAALSPYPLVHEVRGVGFMNGIQLNRSEHPWLSFEHFGYPELADRSTMAPVLCNRLYRRGFFAFSCGHDWGILRLQPRFNIAEATLDAFVQVCREEVEELCRIA